MSRARTRSRDYRDGNFTLRFRVPFKVLFSMIDLLCNSPSMQYRVCPATHYVTDRFVAVRRKALHAFHTR